jgi:hypothetical protein
MIVLFMYTPSMFANDIGNPCVGHSRRELRNMHRHSKTLKKNINRIRTK